MGHPPYLLRWIVWESLYLEKIQKEYDFLTDQGSMGHHPTRLCIEPEQDGGKNCLSSVETDGDQRSKTDSKNLKKNQSINQSP